MKTIIFTLTAMGLGLMAGITMTHRHQVNEMVAQGGIDERLVPESTMEMVAQTSQPDSQSTRLAASDVAEQPASTARYPRRSNREDALLELLAEMRKEQMETDEKQKAMHQQMAEQNREIHSSNRADTRELHGADLEVVDEVAGQERGGRC